ncbi:MAG TPA: hypothetical protein VH165_12780 [Kofleriaceae bacterium]|nr:hypothetical protein [Kofleriaceae bacterium]
MPKIQFVAYEIDTHNTAKLNAILSAKGADPSEMTEQEYFTLQANELRDRLREVTPQLDSTALTVFMAPEFYFKYQNGKPYSRTTFFNVGPYMEMISEAFPEVLWVPGTVWWSEPAKQDTMTVHNTALVYHHGKLIRSWQKERLSTIDGLNAGPEVWDRWELEHERILEATQDPFFLASHGMDTLHVGIEICLDHRTLDRESPPSYGVLRTLYPKNYPEGRGVDIHLLTAAGMPMYPENVVARSGGVFLRCDGGKDPETRSSCVLVARSGNTPDALLEWAPILTLGKPTWIGSDLDNRVAVYPPVTVP